MPRQPRIEFPGAVYHVMARGNRRGRIFLDDEDQETFLRTLGQACERAGFEIYAWVLMGNHYHLALSTPQANLVEGMKWLQNTYTRRFNVRHRAWGRVFGDRYKSVLVDRDSSGGYLPCLLDYIHLNPVRARCIDRGGGESLLDYPWSSIAQCYALLPGKRPSWMASGEGLSIMGYPDMAKGRQALVSDLDERALAERASATGLAEIEGQGLQSTLRRGWYWGSQEFRERLLELLGRGKNECAQAAVGSNRNYRTSAAGHAAAEEVARELLRRGFKHFGLADESELRGLGRGDPRRVAIAWALWRKASVSQSWIAGAVGYRTAANVSQQVRRYDALEKKGSLEEQEWTKIVKIC